MLSEPRRTALVIALLALAATFALLPADGDGASLFASVGASAGLAQHRVGGRDERRCSAAAASGNGGGTGGGGGSGARIALCVQGGAEWLPRWLDVIGAMRRRDEVELFFLSYRGIVDWGAVNVSRARARSSNRGLGPNGDATWPLQALIEPQSKTTWASGRNTLARSAYAAEVVRGVAYSHWAFADADMARVQCRACPAQPARGAAPDPAASAEAAACCLDFLVALSGGSEGLAENYDFAMVHIKIDGWEAVELSLEADAFVDGVFLLRDCGDGNLNVFHREAVPVLLPYHEEFDADSWLVSQVFLWRYATGCLAGASAAPGRAIGTPSDGAGEEHSDYPKGNPWGDSRHEAAFNAAWPALVAEGGPLTAAQSPAYPHCAKGQRMRTTFPLDPVEVPLPKWRESAAYLACLRIKEPNFIASVGSGMTQAPPCIM